MLHKICHCCGELQLTPYLVAIVQNRSRAAMDNNYMLTILAACLYDNHDASKASCQWGLRRAYPGFRPFFIFGEKSGIGHQE